MNLALRWLAIGTIASLAACAGEREQDSQISSTPLFIGLGDEQVVSSSNAELTNTMRLGIINQVREALQRAFANDTFLLVQNDLEKIRVKKIELSEVTRRSLNGRAFLNNSEVKVVGEYQKYRAQFEVSVQTLDFGDLTFYYSIDNLYYYPSLSIIADAGLTINPAALLANLTNVPDFVGSFLGRVLNIQFRIGGNGEHKIENFLFGEMIETSGSNQPSQFQNMLFKSVLQPMCLDLVKRSSQGLTYNDCRPSYEYSRAERLYIDIAQSIFRGPALADIKLNGHGWIIHPVNTIESSPEGRVLTGTIERYRFLNVGSDVINYSYLIRNDGRVHELSYTSPNPTTSWHDSGRTILENAMRAIQASGWLLDQ